jgi:hypothetical protein
LYHIGLAVEHEDSVVIHAHPYIAILVGVYVQNAVVQIWDATGCPCSVSEEVVSVVSTQAIPCGNPNISELVLDDIGHGVAWQTVFGGIMVLHRLQFLRLQT